MVGNKLVQLSIASNSNFSPARVHEICENAWYSFKNQVRILYHHLGVDFIPLNWSKAKATEHFIKGLAEGKFIWLVFGDNESDLEMTKNLKNVKFFSTKKKCI